MTPRDTSGSPPTTVALPPVVPPPVAPPSNGQTLPGPDPMLLRLAAPGPAPEHQDRLRLFGQFVGSWDVDVTTRQPDGTWRASSAEWHFGWVLEGRAVQDVWISPSRADRGRTGAPTEEYGASLRLYDPHRDRWRSIWAGPIQGVFRTFDIEEHPAEIVLLGENDERRAMRWVFSHVGQQRFTWRSEVEESAGDWRIVQVMEARRRRTAGEERLPGTNIRDGDEPEAAGDQAHAPSPS